MNVAVGANEFNHYGAGPGGVLYYVLHHVPLLALQSAVWSTKTTGYCTVPQW